LNSPLYIYTEHLRQVELFILNLISISTHNRYFWLQDKIKHSMYHESRSIMGYTGLGYRPAKRAFHTLVTYHKSFTAYKEAEDKFQGKRFAVYYHRLYKQMMLVENPDYVNPDPFKRIWDTAKTLKKFAPKPPACSKDRVDILNLKTPLYPPREIQPAIIDLSLERKRRRRRCPLQADKLIDTWHELVYTQMESSPRTRRTAYLYADVLDFFQNACQANPRYFQQMCEYITQSDFLMGRKTDFRITLSSLMNLKFFAKIIAGNYHAKPFRYHPTREEIHAAQWKERKDIAEKIAKAYPDAAVREGFHRLTHRLTPFHFDQWILRPQWEVTREDDGYRFSCANAFHREYVMDKFGYLIEDAFGIILREENESNVGTTAKSKINTQTAPAIEECGHTVSEPQAGTGG